jgi:hypothetical protein
MIRSTLLLITLTITVAPALSQETPKATNSNQANLHDALNINDLAITMAESSFKVTPSLKKLSELVGALETSLTRNCYGSMLQTLSYSGTPTDPTCLAQMERLLDLYPNNPVAVCLRDGIDAQSCSDAYRGQSVELFKGAMAPLEDIPDPALKVGLTAADREKLSALEETLKNVNKDYQKVRSDEDKYKYLIDAAQIHDRMLAVACKVAAVKLEEPASAKLQPSTTEDFSIRDAREKLLKLPPALRPEYQRKMLLEAETELATKGKDKQAQQIILKRIAVINNPEDTRLTVSAAGKLRIRIILPSCDEYSQRATKAIPQFPSPTCHREGWHSPQCISALRQWHATRRKMQDSIAKHSTNTTPTAPPSIISSF